MIGLFCGVAGVDWGQKVKIFNLCCYGNKKILNNINGLNNHHTKFEIFPTYWKFVIFGTLLPTTVQTYIIMGKSQISRLRKAGESNR